MRLDSRVVVLAAGLSSACLQETSTVRKANVIDPDVQTLFGVAAAAGWDELGFSPLPTSGSIRVFKMGRATVFDANDAILATESENGSRNWNFRQVSGGYRLACAAESTRGKRSWQRPEINGGRPYHELLDIIYVAENPGRCGTGLKPGLHATYWGPNGIEEVDRDAVVRLRAQLQQ